MANVEASKISRRCELLRFIKTIPFCVLLSTYVPVIGLLFYTAGADWYYAVRRLSASQRAPERSGPPRRPGRRPAPAMLQALRCVAHLMAAPLSSGPALLAARSDCDEALICITVHLRERQVRTPRPADAPLHRVCVRRKDVARRSVIVELADEGSDVLRSAPEKLFSRRPAMPWFCSLFYPLRLATSCCAPPQRRAQQQQERPHEEERQQH